MIYIKEKNKKKSNGDFHQKKQNWINQLKSNKNEIFFFSKILNFTISLNIFVNSNSEIDNNLARFYSKYMILAAQYYLNIVTFF